MLPARPAGLRGLGYAIEAPIGLLEADVISQLVAVGVELTHLPPGLQRIWVGGWGSQPMIQVAPESLHHLGALLLGHEGCTFARIRTTRLCICLASKAECGQGQ